MSKLTELSAWLDSRLPALLAEHKVPGASVAVYAGGEIIDHAAGVLNTGTGVEADTDSLFQIGSITKIWTTTLALQLADEGLLDLDEPVRKYLPEFKIADNVAAAKITVRQLMCHTSGFEGDIFTDTGRGDDCVEKYVATLGDVPQLFAPGEMFSYNNAAFCVLGRVVEVLRGKPYNDCLAEHLFVPLGLTHAAASPYEAIRFRAALGHLTPEPGADPQPAGVWALAASNAPAGSMLAMRPRDLVTFAGMHLRDGEGPDGSRVLSAESARAMRERVVELPDLGLMGEAWGLGWSLSEGGAVVGHDGGTIGQSAFLRLAPGHDVAVALLTNGGNPIALYTEVVGHVLKELTGIELKVPPVPNPEAPRIDATRYVGEYSSSVADITVSQDEDGRVWVERVPKGIFAELAKPEKTELVAMNGDTLILAEPMQGMYLPHAFVGDDGTGRALYLHTGRADRRVRA
ncbi:serine hydrolase domain-containing protein [Amycolatopsis sp. SID8362]|uniref:serine hydrolase domain-containing protein n=1 Tax=Amycolatopsis sp. SID8362 TaxID=2690346 RepID=UPI0013686F2B|nr:serine hydrolase domain-containing protein [Amycolatopsis sp. SID8362]NBH10478.1 serine hydrolase [Amycolatopsis sp. SID8362]NED47172.1 beta-lactamase family protein [Amycolatopsis sp. SID8362]